MNLNVLHYDHIYPCLPTNIVSTRDSSEGPTTQPDPDPGTAERGTAQLSPAYNDQDTLIAQPPIPPRTPDRLMPLSVSKASNETEAIFITDNTSHCDLVFGSGFEDVCPTPPHGSFNLPHRSQSKTPDLPPRTEEMHFMSNDFPCHSVTPEVPPRNEESPDPDMIRTKTLKSSIESLLSEDYDRLSSLLVKQCDDNKSTDIHNGTKCSLNCKEEVKNDMVTEESAMGSFDEASDETVAIQPETSVIERAVNTSELTPFSACSSSPPSPSRSPAIPPKSFSVQVRMETSRMSKREPRPPPPVQRVLTDIPPPPLPPKGLAKSGEETTHQIPSRHIKRKGASNQSTVGEVAEDEPENGMFLMFNSSYHTLVNKFYK